MEAESAPATAAAKAIADQLIDHVKTKHVHAVRAGLNTLHDSGRSPVQQDNRAAVGFANTQVVDRSQGEQMFDSSGGLEAHDRFAAAGIVADCLKLLRVRDLGVERWRAVRPGRCARDRLYVRQRNQRQIVEFIVVAAAPLHLGTASVEDSDRRPDVGDDMPCSHDGAGVGAAKRVACADILALPHLDGFGVGAGPSGTESKYRGPESDRGLHGVIICWSSWGWFVGGVRFRETPRPRWIEQRSHLQRLGCGPKRWHAAPARRRSLRLCRGSAS